MLSCMGIAPGCRSPRSWPLYTNLNKISTELILFNFELEHHNLSWTILIVSDPGTIPSSKWHLGIECSKYRYIWATREGNARDPKKSTLPIHKHGQSSSCWYWDGLQSCKSFSCFPCYIFSTWNCLLFFLVCRMSYWCHYLFISLFERNMFFLLTDTLPGERDKSNLLLSCDGAK